MSARIMNFQRQRQQHQFQSNLSNVLARNRNRNKNVPVPRPITKKIPLNIYLPLYIANTDDRIPNIVMRNLVRMFFGIRTSINSNPNFGRNWSKHFCTFNDNGFNQIFANDPSRNAVNGNIVGNTIHAEANAIDHALRHYNTGIRINSLYKTFDKKELPCFLRKLSKEEKG